jgi:hypothetical protein
MYSDASHLQTIPHDLLSEYISEHERKFAEIITALESDSWSPQKTEQSIAQFSRYVTDSPFVQTKTIVSLPVPKDAMVDVMTYGRVYTLETTPQGPIAPREIFAIYDGKDDNQTIVYFMAMESPAFMVSPREFLLLRRKYVRDGKTIFMQMSIDNSEIKPERRGFVRGTIHGQAFVIEDAENGNSRMTVFSHVNPGGSLPTWAVNYSVKNQLDGLQYISEQAVLYWKRTHE